MKILHCADLHIDSRMNTNFDAEKRKRTVYTDLTNFECTIMFMFGSMFKTVSASSRLPFPPTLDVIPANELMIKLIRRKDKTSIAITINATFFLFEIMRFIFINRLFLSVIFSPFAGRYY